MPSAVPTTVKYVPFTSQHVISGYGYEGIAFGHATRCASASDEVSVSSSPLGGSHPHPYCGAASDEATRHTAARMIDRSVQVVVR